MPAAGINEISIHNLIGQQPEILCLIRHDLKVNGLVTITEHYDRSLGTAFNEAISQDLFKVSERTAAVILHQLLTAINSLH